MNKIGEISPELESHPNSAFQHRLCFLVVGIDLFPVDLTPFALPVSCQHFSPIAVYTEPLARERASCSFLAAACSFRAAPQDFCSLGLRGIVCEVARKRTKLSLTTFCHGR
jgi:hypothetical protein